MRSALLTILAIMFGMMAGYTFPHPICIFYGAVSLIFFTLTHGRDIY